MARAVSSQISEHLCICVCSSFHSRLLSEHLCVCVCSLFHSVGDIPPISDEELFPQDSPPEGQQWQLLLFMQSTALPTVGLLAWYRPGWLPISCVVRTLGTVAVSVWLVSPQGEKKSGASGLCAVLLPTPPHLLCLEFKDTSAKKKIHHKKQNTRIIKKGGKKDKNDENFFHTKRTIWSKCYKTRQGAICDFIRNVLECFSV